MRRYGHAVDFLFVYVMEAHASDEWPLGLRRSTTPQHRDIEARCTAAKCFRARKTRSNLQCGDTLVHDWQGEPADVKAAATVSWFVDTMANEFYHAFGAWPEGHIVVGTDGTLLLRTEPLNGEGCIAGGEWHEQVERVLTEECGLAPCRTVAQWGGSL
eukprot:SAG11_NODE_7098_length_1194_cov_1.010046_2_plen_158_part_00